MIRCIMPRTILVVDDDPHIRQLLVFAFEKAGLDTVEASDGEAALVAAKTHSPHLVILDINMPRMDGLETCRQLRAQGNVPILFLSSRDEEIDRILGIELGGDDYVVKPFSPREVVARSFAILRRTGHNPPNVEDQGNIGHGHVKLDRESWAASWIDQPVDLTVTEFTILRTLMTMPSKIFSRDAIINKLHGPGFAITDRTIDSHIKNLRQKFLAAGCHDLILTRPGVGYSMGACSGNAEQR